MAAARGRGGLSPGSSCSETCSAIGSTGMASFDALGAAWRQMSSGELDARLVLNADDAVVAGFGSDRRGSPPSLLFGIEDRAMGLAGVEHAVDSIRCPTCEDPLRFEIRFLSHLGHHRCDSCGLSRPTPDVTADGIRLDGTLASGFSVDSGAGRFDIRLGLPGLFNVYNALAATSATLALGVDRADISRALAEFTPVFGRGERIRAGATDLLVLLMKNPAGANELMRTLSRDAAPTIDLLIALNDDFSDGRDVSWIWDADFESLRYRIGRVVCSGTRAAELALRLKYAGWPVTRIAIEVGIPAALDRGITEADDDRLIVLPTYSALLELQAELALRGLARPFWDGASVALGDTA